jgi:SAM-dependent methyltransferase
VDASAWDARYADEGSGEFVWTTTPNQFVVAEVEGLRPGRALDLACGEGRNAVWLAEAGWDVTGVDFSAAGLDKAARHAVANGVDDRCRWVRADATTWDPHAGDPDGPGAFDLVVVAYLQLPAAGRAAALGAAVAALAPGGTLVVVAHDTDNLTRGVGGPPDPAVLYGTAEVVGDAHLAAAALPGVDLVVERADQVLRAVDAGGPGGGDPGGVRHAIDLVVRIRRA